ncbi:MAG: hypothetical protein K2Z81_25920 [Cyanobacteria bacterium]|nr:hypothetical protein [Cyanobacteriota bacterium]
MIQEPYNDLSSNLTSELGETPFSSALSEQWNFVSLMKESRTALQNDSLSANSSQQGSLGLPVLLLDDSAKADPSQSDEEEKCDLTEPHSYNKYAKWRSIDQRDDRTPPRAVDPTQTANNASEPRETYSKYFKRRDVDQRDDRTPSRAVDPTQTANNAGEPRETYSKYFKRRDVDQRDDRTPSRTIDSNQPSNHKQDSRDQERVYRVNSRNSEHNGPPSSAGDLDNYRADRQIGHGHNESEINSNNRTDARPTDAPPLRRTIEQIKNDHLNEMTRETTPRRDQRALSMGRDDRTDDRVSDAPPLRQTREQYENEQLNQQTRDMTARREEVVLPYAGPYTIPGDSVTPGANPALDQSIPVAAPVGANRLLAPEIAQPAPATVAPPELISALTTAELMSGPDHIAVTVDDNQRVTKANDGNGTVFMYYDSDGETPTGVRWTQGDFTMTRNDNGTFSIWFGNERFMQDLYVAPGACSGELMVKRDSGEAFIIPAGGPRYMYPRS